MTLSEQITRTEGFLELGVHSEALTATEELPPIDIVEPLVLEVRLRILTVKVRSRNVAKFRLRLHSPP